MESYVPLSRREISNELEAPQIVEMNDAEGVAGIVNDDDRSDAALFHERQRFARQYVWIHNLGIWVHALRNSHAESCSAVRFHKAAKVAVGEDACEGAVGVDDCGHAEFLGGHFVKGVRHGRLWRNFGEFFAGVHDFVHAEEAFAKAACGM